MTKPRHTHKIKNGTIICKDGIRRNAFIKSPAESRFWKFVDKRTKGECWIWKGNKCGSGGSKYPAFWDGENQVKGHRFSYELRFGKIPPGLLACHKCDNSLCVNPHHIFAGTSKQNTADMINKKRTNWRPMLGTNSAVSKWKPDQVLKVLDLWRSGVKQTKIPNLTGVTKTSVGAILQGRVWNHITGLPEKRLPSRKNSVQQYRYA